VSTCFGVACDIDNFFFPACMHKPVQFVDSENYKGRPVFGDLIARQQVTPGGVVLFHEVWVVQEDKGILPSGSNGKSVALKSYHGCSILTRLEAEYVKYCLLRGCK
jgi:hypothetical protein